MTNFSNISNFSNLDHFSNDMVDSKPLVATVLLILCCLLGLPSNIAVIITIARKWERSTSFTVKLMLELAVSDTLTLTLAPFAIHALLYGWNFTIGACRVFMYLTYCAMYVSVLTVTLMAMHHYHILQAKFPNRNELERLQTQRRRLLLMGVWGLAGLFGIPTFFTRDVQVKRGFQRCQRSIHLPSLKVTVLLLEVALGFIVPFVTILASYCWINKIKLQGGQNVKKRKNRMRRLVIAIVTAFFVFWTPVHVISLIDVATTLTKSSFPEAYDQMKSFRRATGDLSKTLAFLNCCANPFLYAFSLGVGRKKGKITEGRRKKYSKSDVT